MLGLIEVLVIIFGEEPPVFARSQSNQQALTQQTMSQPYNTGAANPRPPYPTANTG